jgi:hypothetical protein
MRHRSLSTTLVYARIANRTVADEYFKVSEKVEALYGQPKHLPAQDEAMAKLRREMNRRTLGNARPVELDCHFESICNHAPTSSPHPSSRPSSGANVTMLSTRVRLAANASLMGSSPASRRMLLTPITDITDHAPARMLRHVKPDRNPRRNQGVRVRKQ